MATPLEIRVPSVRVNFATATLRMRMPNTGLLSSKASTVVFPALVLYQVRSMKMPTPAITAM